MGTEIFELIGLIAILVCIAAAAFVAPKQNPKRTKKKFI